MVVFLTSSPCDDNVPEGLDLPCIFDRRNGFVDALRENVAPGARGLYTAADPAAHWLNDEAASTFAGCFAQAGMALAAMDVLDDRTAAKTGAYVLKAEVIILGGGHVPTQNAFFRAIGLRERLTGWNGTVMGISAGSMNTADVVYAQPEEPGEATNPAYRKFICGLGLTDVNILPHYQMVKDNIIDGLRLFEDVTYPDSMGRTFYAVPDGSWVRAGGEAAVLHGEMWRLRDGVMEKVCEDGRKWEIRYGETI